MKRATLVVFALCAGCQSDPGRSPVELVVGGTPPLSFVPKTMFAEYIELPAVRNELRVTIAGYDASCERFVPPREGEASITITILTPPGVEPARETYSFTGEDPKQGPAEHAVAVPLARIGRRAYSFAPGGSVRLTEVALDRDGRVRGLLDFKFAGDADRPASSIGGSFEAKMCRSNRLSPRS